MKHRQDQEKETSDTPMELTGIPDRAKEFIGTAQAGTNCKIRLVPPNKIPDIWWKIEEHLLRMSPHSEGELEPDDFFESLINAEMHLWVAIKDEDIIASMITQFVAYPRKRVLRIISIGGDSMDQWIDQLPMIEDWALTMGCTSIECWGRKGWLKVLKDWKCSYRHNTKRLNI